MQYTFWAQKYEKREKQHRFVTIFRIKSVNLPIINLYYMLLQSFFAAFGRYLQLMGKVFSIPERWRMFFRQYIKEMAQLGVDSIGIVLLISFFIGAVICIQIKLNIQSAWMPNFVTGYTTREIMLLEFSSSIMCLILSGKVGSNIASEIGTMRVTQQIDALEIMGVNSASFLILPKVLGLITMIPFLVVFSIAFGLIGAYATTYMGVITVEDLTSGLLYDFNQWYVWMSIIKSLCFAFIISSVSSFYGYTVEGGSFDVGKASTNAVVRSSMLILFADIFLTQLLS
jgi:phospholipid/cholesterol/gamma-HCH transport system permease protein